MAPSTTTEQDAAAVAKAVEADAKREQKAKQDEYKANEAGWLSEVRTLWTAGEQSLLAGSLVLLAACEAFIAAGLGKQVDFRDRVAKALGRGTSTVWNRLKAAEQAKALGITPDAAAERGITVGMLKEVRQVPEARAATILGKNNLTEQKVAAAVKRAKGSKSDEDLAAAEVKATDALTRKLRDRVHDTYRSLEDGADAGTIMMAIVDCLAAVNVGEPSDNQFKVPGGRIHKAVLTLIIEAQTDGADEDEPSEQ